MEKIFDVLNVELDFEWLMIDANHCKVYPHLSRTKRGKHPDKRGLNTKKHLAVDMHGMPDRVLITECTRAVCKEACALIKGLSAESLLADRGYNTKEIIKKVAESGCQVVIPPKKCLRYYVTMTRISIRRVIWSRMHFSTLSAGEG